MTTNLIKDLGIDYVNENLTGALLFVDDIAHQIAVIEPKRIRTVQWTGTMEAPVAKEVDLPTTLFDKGFEALAYPELGYRVAAGGKILMELKHHQSFKRGLQVAEIIPRFPPVSGFISEMFNIDLDYYHRRDALAVAVSQKCYTPLAKGLQMLKDKEAYVFAVNKHLAVAPSGTAGTYLDIMYKSRVVGSIDEDNNISGKITNVKAVMEKLNEQYKP